MPARGISDKKNSQFNQIAQRLKYINRKIENDILMHETYIR